MNDTQNDTVVNKIKSNTPLRTGRMGTAARRSTTSPKRRDTNLSVTNAADRSDPSMDDISLMDAPRDNDDEQKKKQKGVGANTMAGLTVAGLAASLLTTVFGLFHVDTFLTAYQLPVATYSFGSFIYAIINTANDVGGAWIVDQVATTRKRSDLVGITGCMFALCFLTPFFRPWKAEANSWLWDGAHFVLSLSLYDTMYSFAMILYGSIIADDHEMSEAKRVRFLVLCKVVNLVSSFGVARVGLYIFDTNDLTSFRIFLVALVLVVCSLSIVSQGLISGDHCKLSVLRYFSFNNATKSDMKANPTKTRRLEWKSVARDFWNHPNFRYWVGAEMLLEAQNTFNSFFRKTFFDRLLVANGVDKQTCDWMMSALRPITIIVSLGAYIPIRKYGYPKVYRALFMCNFVLSLIMLLVANSQSENWILAFLVVYPVLTAAVESAGFALAMADMTMEMKHMVVSQGRFDEPSLAGMFMGANALFCKPMESFLPIVAAQAMTNEESAQSNLFYVLVLPPLIFSSLQLLSWWKYDLDPKRAGFKRKELTMLLNENENRVV